MSRYIYGGAAANLGRFGLVQPGQELDLTDQEVASIAVDTDYFLKPTRSRLELKITADTTLTHASSGKRIVCNHAADITLTLPTSPTIGDVFEVYFGDAADPTKHVTLNPGTNPLNASYDVASAVPATAGTGYAIADTLTLNRGTNTTAAILAVATLQAVGSAKVSGGTGYAALDVLTITGGTHSVAATIRVDTVDESGVITGWTVVGGGTYSVKPTGTLATTVAPSGGTGATFTLTWGIKTVTVTTPGAYQAKPTNPVTPSATSGAGTLATLTITWEGAVTTLTSTIDSIGVMWDGASWTTF